MQLHLTWTEEPCRILAQKRAHFFLSKRPTHGNSSRFVQSLLGLVKCLSGAGRGQRAMPSQRHHPCPCESHSQVCNGFPTGVWLFPQPPTSPQPPRYVRPEGGTHCLPKGFEAAGGGVGNSDPISNQKGRTPVCSQLSPPAQLQRTLSFPEDQILPVGPQVLPTDRCCRVAPEMLPRWWRLAAPVLGHRPAAGKAFSCSWQETAPTPPHL